MEDVFTYQPKLAILVNEQKVFLSFLKAEKEQKAPFAESMLCNVALNRITEKAKDFDTDFSHGGFSSVVERLKKHGFTNISEILSAKHNSINALFNHYLKSDAHKAILLGNFDFIGIGIIEHKHKLYSCIIFANHENN